MLTVNEYEIVCEWIPLRITRLDCLTSRYFKAAKQSEKCNRSADFSKNFFFTKHFLF